MSSQQEISEVVSAGLKSLKDIPVGKGYVNATAGASSSAGPFARLEAGYRPAANVGVFGFGQWTPREWSAGLGLGVTF